MREKLIKTLENAINNSPFYFRKAAKYRDINDFYSNFKLTKYDVINHMHEIISNKYDGNLYKYMQVNTTSGTSGIPVKTMWRPEDLMRSNLSIWRERKKYHNISPNDCYCTLHTVSYLGSRIKNIEKIIITNNMISFCKLFYDDSTLFDYYNVMLKYQPKWLLVQPSFALRFVNFCKLHKLPSIASIEYIEFTGELLTNSTRIQVTSFFECQSANMYGCMETNSVAYECPNGIMHVLSDNVELETDNEDNIYLTSLTNRAFPLIKYEVGDKIKIDRYHSHCCGGSEIIIKSIIGRSSKEILVENGNVINESMIAYCIERTESIVGLDLKQYKAIYTNNSLIIEVICSTKNDKWRDVFIKEAVKQFDMLCNYTNVSFKFVDTIYRTKSEESSGKYSILEVI